MKHVFVINPAAGSKNHSEEIERMLQAYRNEIDYEIYVTKKPMDAVAFVSETCKNTGDTVRFYACGGDGTLNEVINGAYGHGNAEIACFPCGSGDDFVKYYGGKDSFINLENSIEGTAETIDVMKVNGKYAVNIISFGFDSYVAKTISKVKRKFLIGGKNSYITGVIYALIAGMKSKCRVYVDGVQLNDESLLLCTLANGSHVGGSYNCAPRSKNNDGLIDVCLVNPVSHLTFLKLMGKYQRGEHLDDPGFRKTIRYMQGKSVRCVSSENRPFYISVDGEVLETNDFTVEIVPSAVKFVVPKTCLPSKKERARTCLNE